MTKPAPGVLWDVSLFFESLRGDGWSEKYTLAIPPATPPFTVTNDLWEQRRKFLNSNYRLVYARVSDPGVNGDLLFVATTLTLPNDGVIVGDSLPGTDAWLVRFRDAVGASANRYFHGLTDADVDDLELVIAASPTQVAGDAFFAYLEAQLYGWWNYNATAIHPISAFHSYFDHFARPVTSHRVGRPFGLRRGRTARTGA